MLTQVHKPQFINRGGANFNRVFHHFFWGYPQNKLVRVYHQPSDCKSLCAPKNLSAVVNWTSILRCSHYQPLSTVTICFPRFFLGLLNEAPKKKNTSTKRCPRGFPLGIIKSHRLSKWKAIAILWSHPQDINMFPGQKNAFNTDSSSYFPLFDLCA